MMEPGQYWQRRQLLRFVRNGAVALAVSQFSLACTGVANQTATVAANTEPYVYEVRATVAAVPLSRLVQQASFIAFVEVSRLLPARWDTPGGARPAEPQRTKQSIYRPVEVRIVEQLQGSPLPSSALLAAHGGQIGRDTVGVYPSDLFEYAPGERTLLFLDPPEVFPLGTEHMPVYKLVSKYVLTGDDRLHDVDPDRPYSDTFRQYTWQEIRSTIAAQAPIVPTATR